MEKTFRLVMAGMALFFMFLGTRYILNYHHEPDYTKTLIKAVIFVLLCGGMVYFILWYYKSKS